MSGSKNQAKQVNEAKKNAQTDTGRQVTVVQVHAVADDHELQINTQTHAIMKKSDPPTGKQENGGIFSSFLKMFDKPASRKSPSPALNEESSSLTQEGEAKETPSKHVDSGNKTVTVTRDTAIVENSHFVNDNGKDDIKMVRQTNVDHGEVENEMDHRSVQNEIDSGSMSSLENIQLSKSRSLSSAGSHKRRHMAEDFSWAPARDRRRLHVRDRFTQTYNYDKKLVVCEHCQYHNHIVMEDIMRAPKSDVKRSSPDGGTEDDLLTTKASHGEYTWAKRSRSSGDIHDTEMLDSTIYESDLDLSRSDQVRCFPIPEDHDMLDSSLSETDVDSVRSDSTEGAYTSSSSRGNIGLAHDDTSAPLNSGMPISQISTQGAYQLKTDTNVCQFNSSAGLDDPTGQNLNMVQVGEIDLHRQVSPSSGQSSDPVRLRNHDLRKQVLKQNYKRNTWTPDSSGKSQDLT